MYVIEFGVNRSSSVFTPNSILHTFSELQCSLNLFIGQGKDRHRDVHEYENRKISAALRFDRIK